MITLLKRLLVLVVLLKLLESGCHVRRRHASSAAVEAESRLEKMDEVGDASVLLAGENAPALELFIDPGPNNGRPRFPPSGDWKGFPPEDGTLSLRPGVREPVVYMLCDREWVEVGDATADHRGLLWPVEKVAEVGVLKSLGDTGL